MVALAWPNHVHHARARGWFVKNAGQGWATCPMTQCRFVRISANAKIIAEAVTVQEAAALLSDMLGHPNHIFRNEDLGFAEAVRRYNLQGFRQVTDAYLLGLARQRGGLLVTLDGAVAVLAGKDSESVMII